MDQKTVNVTVIVQLVKHQAGRVAGDSHEFVHLRTMEIALQEWFHFVMDQMEEDLGQQEDLVDLVDHQEDQDKDPHLKEDKWVQAKVLHKETVLVLK